MYRKEEGTWDGRIRDGGTNSTLRIKEQEKHQTLNEHDDDDDDDDDVDDIDDKSMYLEDQGDAVLSSLYLFYSFHTDFITISPYS